MPAGRPPDPTSARHRGFALLDAKPDLTGTQLAALLGCPSGTGKAVRQLWTEARGVVRRRTVETHVEEAVVPLSEWQRRALRCATDAELRLVAPWMMDLARQEGIVP